MSLPAGVTSHHTAWVSVSGSKAHPVRYAVDGSRLVCFGDESLVHVPDNTRVSVSIHEIAGGHLLAEFSASLHCLAPEAVTMSSLTELLDHVALGRSLGEVGAHLDDERAHRRIVELVP